MENTTTPVDGVASDTVVSNDPAAAQPTNPDTGQTQTTEAVTGAEPTSTEQTAVETETIETTQADDIESWAKQKGLPLDDPVKLAKMYRDAEKKMHEATAKSRELETAAVDNLNYTGDNEDPLRLSVNQLLIQNKVRDFFDSNPEARDYETEMAKIVQERPHLQNDLDALFALAAKDTLSGKEGQLKAEGGREALTNLAQKQAGRPPVASATNSADYTTSKITPENVERLVAQNDMTWYKANRTEILRASNQIE